MQKKIGSIIVISFLLLASCRGKSGIVVATVGGTNITADSLKAEIMMEQNKYDMALLRHKANFEQLRKRALDKLVQEAVLLDEARRIGIKLTPAEQKEANESIKSTLAASKDSESVKERGIDPDAWAESQKRRMLIQKLIWNEVIGKIPVSNEKIAAYYRSHSQEFNKPAEFHARQIIVNSREQAEQILDQLKNGKDFAELAKGHSLSPDGKRGGDLGFFDSRTYPEAFAEVCQQLKIGELSNVIQTDYGFQIFELLDKRPARQVPFEEAAPEIERRLKEAQGEAALAKWTAALEANAKVGINEETLKGVMQDEKK